MWQVGLQSIFLYVGASVAFDVVHYALHRFQKSRFSLFRAIGKLHEAHHQFLPQSLQIDSRFTRANLLMHVLPEFLTRALFVVAFVPLFGLIAPLIVLAIYTLQFVGVCLLSGVDSHHHSIAKIPLPGHGFFVGSAYHAYHHLFPERYFSSLVKVFDYVFGFGIELRGKSVVMTGARGSFGRGMYDLLREEGVREIRTLTYGVDYHHDKFVNALEKMKDADILVLSHGSKENPMQANHDSFVALIEQFLAINGSRRIPVEVWAVGSESEFHPAIPKSTKPYSDSKRAFAAYASVLYRRQDFTYRHIVPASFSSRMGPGLISGKTAARVALWFIKRGFQYVPVTYTTFAFFNYFKFRWLGLTRKNVA